MSNENKEIQEEIRDVLQKGSFPHLADSLDDVPEDKLIAIYNMMSDMEARRAQKKEIINQVTEDVSAALEGKELQFSQPFLTINL